MKIFIDRISDYLDLPNSTRLPSYHQGAETFECLIPLSRDLIQVTANFRQSPCLEFPNALATGATAAYEPSVLECAEMFRNGLTRDRGALRQLNDREGTAVTQSRDDPQARVIAQSGE
jgi:hypothetical protein